jgi:hypothetical protein
MNYNFKLKKANGQTEFAKFDKQPSWQDLASSIDSLFCIPSENVGVAFVVQHSVVTIEGEVELQRFYDQYPCDNNIKFVVQDTKDPDRECVFWSPFLLMSHFLFSRCNLLLIILITFAAHSFSRNHGNLVLGFQPV